MLMAMGLFLITSCQKEAEKPVEKAETSHALNSNISGTTNIATIELDNQRRVEFHQTNDGDVLVAEIGYSKNFEKNPILLPDENVSILKTFLSVTNSNIAIPQAIVDAERKVNPAVELTRPVVANLNKTIKLSYTETEMGRSRMTESQFRNIACPTNMFSTSTNIKFCDAGLWTNHIRNSYYYGWRKLNRTSTATSSENGATVDIYWNKSTNTTTWSTVTTGTVHPGQYIVTNMYIGGPSYLQVQRTVRSASSNRRFRAYTNFFL